MDSQTGLIQNTKRHGSRFIRETLKTVTKSAAVYWTLFNLGAVELCRLRKILSAGWTCAAFACSGSQSASKC